MKDSASDIFYFAAVALIIFLKKVHSKRKKQAKEQKQQQIYKTSPIVREKNTGANEMRAQIKPQVLPLRPLSLQASSYKSLKVQGQNEKLKEHHLKGKLLHEDIEDKVSYIEELTDKVSLKDMVILSEIYNNPFI